MNLGHMMRAFSTLLEPLTGERATGAVLATATGADVEITHGNYLLPVVRGQLRTTTPYKLTRNTSSPSTNERGHWVVTSAGIEIPIYSCIGGARHNLPVGTTLRWATPFPAGLDPIVTVTAAGVTGGADPSGFGVIQRVGLYEELQMPLASSALFKAQIDKLPAVVLVWDSGTPSEGAAGDKITKAGYGTQIWREIFQVLVVVDRHDTDEQRRSEGLQLLDDVTELLNWRNATDDGLPLSHPEAIQFLSRFRSGSEGQFYIYGARFRASRTVQKRDARTFSTWLRSRVTIVRPDSDLGDLEIADIEVNQ